MTPFETVEWLWVPIYAQAKPDDPSTETLFTDVLYSVVVDGQRPVIWRDPDIRAGYTGVQVSGLAAGTWRIWAKAISPPDAPVIDCGTFTLD